ncbi:MAG: alpha/beta fold hydrolase [Methanomicrobiales archaeon]
METYVLVQGGNMSTQTWNKLSGQNFVTKNGYMGASYWDGTAKALRSAGHRVFAPTLSDEFSSSMTDHIHQICDIIVDNHFWNIILIGHSYGGFVITGVAERMPERIRTLVYVDSALPDPGQSLIEVLDSVYSKEDYVAAVPDANPPYIEKLYYDPVRLEEIKKVYIRCTKSEFLEVTSLSKEKIDKDKGKWTYFELSSSHVPMADLPEDFYKLLLKIAKL